jgi:predicted nucleic acid-binding protein
MAFVVVYDACVLYPAPLRDLLLRIARTGLVRARWSEAILDECFRAILENRADLRAEALQRTRALMKCAVPDCIVENYEGLIDGLTLPDPDDRHVLAAAIRAGAQVIVTFNIKDFPAEALATHEMEAKHADEFVIDQLGLAPAAVVNVIVEQSQALKNPPRSVADLLETLRDCGLAQSVAKLRELFGA